MVRRNVAEQQQHSHTHSQSNNSNSNGNGNNNNNNGQRSGDNNNNAGGCTSKTMSTTSMSSNSTVAAATAPAPQQHPQQQQQHCATQSGVQVLLQQHSPSDGGSSNCSLPASPPLLRQTATPPQGAQIVPPVCALHHPQQQLALLAAMQHHHHHILQPALPHHMQHQPAPAPAPAPAASQQATHQHQHQHPHPHQHQHQHQQPHENGHGGMSPNGGSGGSSASSVSSVTSCNGGGGGGQANMASNGTNGIGPPPPAVAQATALPPAPLYIQYPGDFFPSEFYIAPHPHEGICPQHPHHPHAQQHHHQPMCAISAEFGPAAVQMVSHNRPPPTMALPVQVPPYVNENGTLTHVVLPPQQYQQLHHGQGHLHAAPFISGNGTSHYYTPMPGYPPGPGPAGNGPPHYHMPPPPGAPQQQQQQPAGSAGVGAASSATSQPHLHSPHSPSPPNYTNERSQRQHTKLLRKLEQANKQKQQNSTLSTPTHSPSPRRNDTNGHQQQHYNGLRPQQQQQHQQCQTQRNDNAVPAGRQVVTSHPANAVRDNVEDGGDNSSCNLEAGDDEEDQSASIVDQISAIEKPEVIDVSSRAAKIFWAPPSNTDVMLINAQDLRYQVLLSDSGKQCKYKSLYRGEAYECIVQDLLPGQEYLVRLQVQYKQFQGGVSEPTEFKTPACEPDQPLPPKLMSRTKSTINLRWTAPACNGSPIQHYLLEYDEGRGNALQFVELAKIKAKHYVLTKLQPTTVYSFRLAAVNHVGQSIYSEVTSYSTAGNPPTAPKAPQLQASTASSLQLVWERRSQDGDFLLQLQDSEFGHGYLNSYKGGDTHYECLQLRRATSYQFRLRAENDAGVSPWSPEVSYSTAPERPGRPGKPHSKGKIHGTHFKARWEMPTDTGGGEIIHYHLELSAGGPNFERIYSGADAEAKCESLQPGTTYQLRVCCEGPAGMSPFSDIGHVTTEAVPPAAPPMPYCDAPLTPYAALIRLSQPENNGGSPVQEFEAQLRQVTERVNETQALPPAQIVYRDKADFFVAQHLLPGCTYEVQARAINRVGAGNWSQWLRFTTAVAPPAAPEALQALVKSSSQLCVSWRTPTLNNGANVTGYTLQSVSQSLEEPEVEPLGTQFSNCYQGAQTNVELRQLTPYTRYYLRVLASNVAGTGSPSDVVCVATLAAVPGAPQMQGYEFTAQEVTLNWTQPAAHGSPICSYNIEYGEKTIATPDACTRYTIGDLTPETSYKFRVQAVNAIGAGTFSAYAKLTTQPAPPAPPRLECSGAGHNFIKLKWSSSSATSSGDFTKYFVEMYVARAKQFQNVYSGTNCMCKINKLQERSSYTFRIYAHTDRAGDGDYSEEFVFQTTATLPANIKAPRVLHVGSVMPLEQSGRMGTQLTLEWQHSKNTFYDRVEYELQYAVIASSSATELNPAESSESRSESNSRNNGASGHAAAAAPLSLSNQEYHQLYRGLETKFTIDNLVAGNCYQFRVCPVRVTSSGELIYGQASTALRYQVPRKLTTNATPASNNHYNGTIAVAPAAAQTTLQRFSRSKQTTVNGSSNSGGGGLHPRSISASAISGNGSGVGVDLQAIGRLQHEISTAGFNACGDPLHHHHHHHHHHHQQQQQQHLQPCLTSELSTNSSSSASALLLRGKSSDVQHHMHHQHHLHHSHHVHHAHYSHLLMGGAGAPGVAAGGGKVANSSCLQHGGGLIRRTVSRLTTFYSNRKRLTDQQKAVFIVVSFVFVTFLVAMLVNMLRG